VNTPSVSRTQCLLLQRKVCGIYCSQYESLNAVDMDITMEHETPSITHVKSDLEESVGKIAAENTEKETSVL
jgi:hypothetical protein